MRICDVAVVGSGPAGAAAALTVAQAGRSVVVIAPDEPLADQPGEFLSPAAQPLLVELGLAERTAAGPHRAANATFSAWATPHLAQSNAILHTEGVGRILDRPAFQQTLSEAVSGAGVPRLCGVVRHAEREGALWHLRMSDGTTERARFLIDASGRRAIIARHLTRSYRSDRLTGAYAFLPHEDNDVEPTPATLIEAGPRGWWYASLLPDRRLALAYFSDPDCLPRGLSRDLEGWRAMIQSTTWISRWLDTAGHAATRPPRLASARTMWLECASGLNWAAVGDAAAAFDPLSSHGLTTALWSGRRAAQGALAALEGDHRLLEAYSSRTKEAVRRFAEQRKAVYGQVARFSRELFWRRRLV